MIGERWQAVKTVLESALQLESAKRSAYLDQACSSDSSLRREVESLLAADQKAQSGFLQSPALERKLEPGRRLGDYEIQSLLGAGGMGEVYRAPDLRLRREVAIKVLPAMVSNDPERKCLVRGTCRAYGEVPQCSWPEADWGGRSGSLQVRWRGDPDSGLLQQRQPG